MSQPRRKQPLSMPELTPVEVRPKDFDHYRDLWRRAERREFLSTHPLHLDMELTSHCNLACPMCWQSGSMTTPKGSMDPALFRRIVDTGVGLGLSAIKLQIRGESTLHPEIVGLTRHAKDAGVMDVQLTTNGTVLGTKPTLLEDMLISGLDKLIFSIDPAHDASAREIYGENKAPDLRQVVARAMELREASGIGKPILRIQTFAQPAQSVDDRLAEIEAEFPHADEYFINPLWNSQWDVDSIPGLSADYDLLPCVHLWTRLAIYWDGMAYLCPRDYECRYPMGDANRQSVSDIWLGEPMMAMRRAHLDGRRGEHALCGHCDMCAEPKSSGMPPQSLWLQVD